MSGLRAVGIVDETLQDVLSPSSNISVCFVSLCCWCFCLLVGFNYLGFGGVMFISCLRLVLKPPSWPYLLEGRFSKRMSGALTTRF